MFHNLYEDLPAPKSSSAVSDNTANNEQFAAKLVEKQTETSAPTREENTPQLKKETTTTSRWSTAAARLLQPPPSVLVKRQTWVSKPAVKDKLVITKQDNEKQGALENDKIASDMEKEQMETIQVEQNVATGKLWHIMDEYDPHRPNDFETCLRERERKKAQEVLSSFGK